MPDTPAPPLASLRIALETQRCRRLFRHPRRSGPRSSTRIAASHSTRRCGIRCALAEDDLLEYCRRLDWWLAWVGHPATRMLLTADFDCALEELERRGLPDDVWLVRP